MLRDATLCRSQLQCDCTGVKITLEQTVTDYIAQHCRLFYRDTLGQSIIQLSTLTPIHIV